MPQIEIVAYRPAWEAEFREIAHALRVALGEIALRIDHIGSTSVPGLPAKDVIDVQVTVAILDANRIAEAVRSIGYTVREDITGDHVPPGVTDAGDAWSKVYLRTPEGQRPTPVHIRKDGNPNQRYALLFRDYLRAHPFAADAYRQIKQALARLHPDDQDAYYDVKDPVCDITIETANAWAQATGWSPGESDA